jgi:hypothetical protein
MEDMENADPKQKPASKPKRTFKVPAAVNDLVTTNSSIVQPLEAPKSKSKPKLRVPRKSENDGIVDRSSDDIIELLECHVASCRSRGNSTSSSMSAMSDLIEVPNPNPELIKEKVECEVCSERVPKEMYDAWTSQHPIVLYRDKQKFCREHKTRNAREAWASKGYPNIKWEDSFDKRLQGYKPFLLQTLRNPNQSFFRAQLQDAVDRGEARTVQRQIYVESQRSTVGYYGTRGLGVM